MMVLRLHEGPEVMRRTRAKAGFTIIELMVVVAIVAVLATVAVMAYTRHVRKARAGEVTVMINEFKTKEEAYHAERGQYLPLSPLGEGTPVWLPDDLGACTPKVGGQFNLTSAACQTSLATWSQLRVSAGKGSIWCQYTVVAGTPATSPGGGTWALRLFTAAFLATPTKDWFFVMARCNFDNYATFSQYASGGDTAVVESIDDGE